MAVCTRSGGALVPGALHVPWPNAKPTQQSDAYAFLSFVQHPLQDVNDCSAGTSLSGSPLSSEAGTLGLSFTWRHTAADHRQLPESSVLGEENCSRDCLRPLGK